MKNLTSLKAQNNKMKGYIPANFTGLTGVTYLDLSYNYLEADT